MTMTSPFETIKGIISGNQTPEAFDGDSVTREYAMIRDSLVAHGVQTLIDVAPVDLIVPKEVPSIHRPEPTPAKPELNFGAPTGMQAQPTKAEQVQNIQANAEKTYDSAAAVAQARAKYFGLQEEAPIVMPDDFTPKNQLINS